MPAVRLGVGIELSGALHIAPGCWGSPARWGCSRRSAGSADWSPPGRGLANLSQIREVTPKLEAPSIHGMKVESTARRRPGGPDLAVLEGLGGYFGIAEARIRAEAVGDPGI